MIHKLFFIIKELVSRNKSINFKKNTTQTLVNQNSNPNENNQIDINCREPKFQMTPLMIASLRGSRDIVVYLINHGANISLTDIKRYFLIVVLVNFNRCDLFILKKDCLYFFFKYNHISDKIVKNRKNL